MNDKTYKKVSTLSPDEAHTFYLASSGDQDALRTAYAKYGVLPVSATYKNNNEIEGYLVVIQQTDNDKKCDFLGYAEGTEINPDGSPVYLGQSLYQAEVEGEVVVADGYYWMRQGYTPEGEVK